MKRSIPLITAAAAAFLAVSGCSDGGGSANYDTSAATPSPTPTSGKRSFPAPSPSPTPKGVGVEDLAGGWTPIGTNDGVYTLLIDKSGDADSVGSPGPYSPGGDKELCFGSVKGRGEFQMKLDCHSLDDLKGPGRAYRGTATVGTPTPESSIRGCDKGPGVLVITWEDGNREALC